MNLKYSLRYSIASSNLRSYSEKNMSCSISLVKGCTEQHFTSNRFNY